jgi:hypothetical protein
MKESLCSGKPRLAGLSVLIQDQNAWRKTHRLVKMSSLPCKNLSSQFTSKSAVVEDAYIIELTTLKLSNAVSSASLDQVSELSVLSKRPPCQKAA